MQALAARWGLLLALILAPVAGAQDAHYWTRQFGNRAWLLGGSFVGNPGDISVDNGLGDAPDQSGPGLHPRARGTPA